MEFKGALQRLQFFSSNYVYIVHTFIRVHVKMYIGGKGCLRKMHQLRSSQEWFFFIPFDIVMFYCVTGLALADLFLNDECVPRCCQWFFFIPFQSPPSSLWLPKKMTLWSDFWQNHRDFLASYGDNMNNWRTNAHYPNFFPLSASAGLEVAAEAAWGNVYSSG